MGSVVSKYVFFPPTPCSYNEKSPYPVTFITAKNGKKVPAYYLKSDNPNEKVHIIYSHGNAADIGLMYEFLKLLRDHLKVNVLGYDYIGYGMAQEEGVKPSESNCFIAADACYNYLINDLKVEPQNLVIFGTSLGTGVSTYLATKHGIKYRGVVLESPFTSIVRIVTETPIGRAVDIFDSLKRIKSTKSKVLIIHGTDDKVVPFDHGQVLFNNIPQEFRYDPTWVPGAGHDDMIQVLTLPVYIKKLKDFIFEQDSSLYNGGNSNNNNSLIM